MKKFNVPEEYQAANLGDFTGPMIESVKRDVGFTDGYFITGPTGTGKTHLACAILKRWVALCRADKLDPAFYSPTYRTLAWFMPIPELFIELQGKFGEKGGECKAFKRLSEMKAVVLDDLKSDLKAEWQLERLYAILSKRVNWNFPTVVTSNNTLNEFEALDPRLRSRLGSYRVITLMGQDRRDKSKAADNG